MAIKDKKALLEKVRKKLRESRGSSRDPDQFRVTNTKAGEPPTKFRFVVLPGLSKGDKCVGGVAKSEMDDHFCIAGGVHWINRQPHGCPRLYDGEECPWCTLGFGLLDECDIQEERSKISGKYLAKSTYLVNIYFPAFKMNPEELHGKVMWYPMPKTIFDKMDECFMRDNAGDDPEHDPKPWGIFFDPEECLIFQLEVYHKGGFNSYENSKFLLQKSRLAETDEQIQAILDLRHDLKLKAHPRDADELEKMLEKMYGNDGDKDDKGGDKGGGSKPESKAPPTDEDEDVLPKSTKGSAPPPPKKEEDEDVLPKSTKGSEPPKEEPKPAAEVTSSDDIDDPELKALIDDVQGDV
jgi:hypothetical protein